MQTAQQPAPSRFSEKQPTIHSLIFPLIKLIGVFAVLYLFFKIQGGTSGEESLKIFTSSDFLTGVVIKGCVLAIAGIGLSLALGAGLLDLSTAGVMALSGTMMSLYISQSPDHISAPIWMLILIGAASGAACGILSGVLSGILRLPSAAVSIALFLMFCSITQALQPSISHVSAGITETSPLSAGLLVAIVAGLGVVLQFIVRKTTFGVKLRACGANINSAREAGIPVATYGFIALLICGILAGISGSLDWQIDSAHSMQPMGYSIVITLQILIVAILGGASIRGGYTQPLATIIAAMVVALFFSGVSLINASAYVAEITTGFILLLCLIRNKLLGR